MKNEYLSLPMNLILARHAQYPSNVETAKTGDEAWRAEKLSDEEDARAGLDETGNLQKRRLGEHLLERFPGGFAACMTSDFDRTQETADSIVDSSTARHVTLALRERDRGEAARLPTAVFEARFPELATAKARSPRHWPPPGGETLWDKAITLRKLLPEMGRIAAGRSLLVVTSGEVVIAGRTLTELGNMDDEALKRGLTDGWPALKVDNVQYDHYTRIHPETGKLSGSFDYMISFRTADETVTDSGWIRIKR